MTVWVREHAPRPALLFFPDEVEREVDGEMFQGCQNISISAYQPNKVVIRFAMQYMRHYSASASNTTTTRNQNLFWTSLCHFNHSPIQSRPYRFYASLIPLGEEVSCMAKMETVCQAHQFRHRRCTSIKASKEVKI